MLTIQTQTLSGSIIEKARWKVDDLNVQIGHMVQLSLPIKDRRLMDYIRNQSKLECMIENGEEKSKYSVNLAFKVKSMRHMLDAETLGTESMCVVSPMDRFVENVLLFLLDRKKCDPRFVAAIKPVSNQNPDR